MSQYNTNNVLDARRAFAPAEPIQPGYQRIGNLVMGVLYLTRPPQGSSFTIGLTPVLIASPPFLSPILITNKNAAAVALSQQTMMASGATAVAGNTQLTPLSVGNFLNEHFFLDVTACTGTWDFYLQAQDPLSTKWVDIQALFSDITSISTYYAYTGALGVAKTVAVRWVPTSAGSITFSLSTVLKQGLGGSVTGAAGTIFIGGSSVNVGNGLPLYEGTERVLYTESSITLYAVAAIAGIVIQVYNI